MKDRKIAMEDLKVTSFVTDDEKRLKGGTFTTLYSEASDCTNIYINCC